MLQSMGSQRVGHDLATEQQQKVESCVLSSRNFQDLRPGSSISSNPEKTALRRQGEEPGYTEVLQQKAAAAKSLQLYPTLCDPIDNSPPGSSVPGIVQARILEWIAISFSNACMHAKSLQACPTLCDPMDSSPPGSCIHRILQARILEWVAISFSTTEGGQSQHQKINVNERKRGISS